MVCLRYTQNKLDAEDILQDGFVKIFANIHQFENRGSFEGWMKMIVVNTALEYHRKKKISFIDIDTSEIEFKESNCDILSNLGFKELLYLIQQLPSGCKVIFNLYVFEQLTHKEIAEKLSISESTSKSQLARARQLLQDKIEPKKIITKHIKLNERKEHIR